MRLILQPQRRDDDLSLSVAGDVLTVNGEEYDFSVIPNGGTLPSDATASDMIGPVDRIAGEIRAVMVLPHGANPPPEVAFPEAIVVSKDGPIALPGGANE